MASDPLLRIDHLRRFALLAALALIACATPGLAHAQLLIQVNPARFSLTATAGKPLLRDIQFSNLGDLPVVVRPRLSDWSLSEDGEMSLANPGTTVTSLRGFVEFDTAAFTLAPNATHWVHLRLSPLETGEPTRWGVILSEVKPAPGASLPAGAASTAEVGTTIYLSRVPGDEAHAELSALETVPAGHDGLVVTARVRNTGQRQVSLAGEFALVNEAGQRLDNSPIEGAVVLPGAFRTLRWPLSSALRPGSLRVTLTLDAGPAAPLTRDILFDWPPPRTSAAAVPPTSSR